MYGAVVPVMSLRLWFSRMMKSTWSNQDPVGWPITGWKNTIVETRNSDMIKRPTGLGKIFMFAV